MMRLAGPEGSFFELNLAGYQYPADVESPLPEMDLNWLEVCIRARTPEGLEWQATDPCLLTWELEELARWLEMHSYDDKAFPFMDFTEPCLSLDVQHQGRASHSAILQVQLACELAPPDAAGKGSADVVLRFAVSDDDLAAVALACRALCTRFPRRTAAQAQDGGR